ncbi:MAG: hypothetical protein KDK51_03915 [Deltaproteobacteria bacterium]|nr:hypothetical protein [Deltaproteobacteria bacterium]
MKKTIGILLLSLCFHANGFAQEQEEKPDCMALFLLTLQYQTQHQAILLQQNTKTIEKYTLGTLHEDVVKFGNNPEDNTIEPSDEEITLQGLSQLIKVTDMAIKQFQCDQTLENTRNWLLLYSGITEKQKELIFRAQQ